MKHLLIVLAFVFTTLPVQAQRFEDDELRACTLFQASGALSLLVETGIVNETIEVIEELGSGRLVDLDQMMEQAQGWHETWYEDVLPRLPNCAYASKFAQVFSRYLDELYLTITYANAGRLLAFAGSDTDGQAFSDRAGYHADNVAALLNDLNDLLDEINR